MHPVRDDTYLHAVVRKQSTHGARFSVSQRSHRVVQVGTQAKAGFHGPCNLFVGSLRVAGAGEGALLQQKLDRLQRVRKLGRQGHDLYLPGVEELPQKTQVYGLQVGGVVRSLAFRGKERSLEVCTQNTRTSFHRTFFEGVEELLVALGRRRDQRGQKRGYSGGWQPGHQGLDLARVLSYVRAECAVDLQIYEARAEQPGEFPALPEEISGSRIS